MTSADHSSVFFFFLFCTARLLQPECTRRKTLSAFVFVAFWYVLSLLEGLLKRCALSGSNLVFIEILA
jgi:hypothetical protein